jgi:thiol-disulfide isomerase/thioredoxin
LEDDGSFEIDGNIPGMGIYQMRLGDGEDKIIPLTMLPNDNVEINATFENFVTKPVFSGTEWATALTKYMDMFADFAQQQKGLAQMESQGATEEELMKRYFKLREPLDTYAKKQMIKTPDNPVNIILSSSLSPNAGFAAWDSKNLDVLKNVSKAFNKRFPGSPLAANMESQLIQIENGYQQYLASGNIESSESPAEIAPQISMKNPDGKIINLSDLKGKYVLIDFWASWCGPCRKENPNVVRLYNEYKDKGFTVFSVSLDNDPNAWKAAILRDGLVWPNHVSDLLKWQTPLIELYGFNSIPHTVLIDETGKVIAKNLRGASLEQKLKEIL